MIIKVLGTGCSNCKVLHENVLKALEELNMTAEVIKEEDLMAIMGYNVMSMPGLVIDEKVVSAGKKLSVADVKAILTK